MVNQLAVTSGILISNVLGLEAILGTAEYWPVLLALAGVPVILQGADSISYLRLPLVGKVHKWVVKTCHRIKLECFFK